MLIKTVVALIAISEYAHPLGTQSRLESLPHSAKQQSRLRTLFESARYRAARFEVLELAPCSDSGDAIARLKQLGDLARSDPYLSVVLVWSGHGQTFDRQLRLATPECTKPIDEAAGLAAAEIIVQSGAKSARNFCVFIDACEAGASALEFSQVAAARSWSDVDREHSFAAFYASYPFSSAKDGTYLSLLASLLEKGPSKEAEAKTYELWGNLGFNDKDRLLSASDIDQGIAAEILAHPDEYHGLRPPGATVFGRQYLFPNPRFRTNAPARMVDEKTLDVHFLPKARGIEFGERGWYFTGRVQATRDILRWATSESSTMANVYVLTGEGGTGKSALMGRLIALSDLGVRECLRNEGWNEEEDRALGTLPPADLFDAAVHLRNLTAQRVVEQLAEILKLDRPESPEAFVESIGTRSKAGVRVAFDALDEAEDPQAVALRVIRPLAKSGWRAIVATRRSSMARGANDLISLLSSVSTEPQDLDADTHTAADIVRYVAARIRAGHSPQFAGDPSLIELTGRKVSERAGGKFLYARIATSNLLRCVDEISEQTLDGLLGKDVGDVFDQDLRALNRAFQTQFKRKDRGATRLLEALAWAQGGGIPIRDSLWATVANALASQSSQGTPVRFDDGHVHWVLREAGRYILEDGDGDQAVYRLFHQYLVEYFRSDPSAEADPAHAVATSLNHVVEEMGGWRHANPYLVRHMAAHWAGCRPQAELQSLLLDFEWIRARLEGTNVHALLKDYEYVTDAAPQAVSVVARTLSMTAHILVKDPPQLIAQLLGRLPPLDEPLRALCEAARRAIDRLLLLPRLGGLRQAGPLIRVIEVHGAVNSIAFSSDGSCMASADSEGTVRLWDARSGQNLGEPLRGHEGWVNSVAFSPDGTRVVSGGLDGTVRLWDARSGETLREPLRGHEGSVQHVAFSPDGNRVASGGYDGTVRLWDSRSGQALGRPVRGHASWVCSLAFSPDSLQVISAGYDGTVRVWDTRSGQVMGEPLSLHQESVASVTFTDDGCRVILRSSKGIVRLLNGRTGETLRELFCDHEGETISGVALSLDGSLMVSGSYAGTVRLWDVRIGPAQGKPLRGHEGSVLSVAFSPDGSRAASGGADGTVCLWDARIGQAQRESQGESQSEHEGEVSSVAFSPNGNRVASGGSDGTVRLWDAFSGQTLGEPLCGQQGEVLSVAFSPDGGRVVSGGEDGSLCLWDARNGQMLGDPLCEHDGEVSSVAFSPDGSRVASGGSDGAVRLWDAFSGRALGEPLRGHNWVYSVAFSPDGARIVSGGSDGSALLRDAHSGQVLGEPLRGHKDEVVSVAFSPDGNRVASGGADGTVRLWDAFSGRALGEPLRGHEGWVNSVAFSPDGSLVVSAGDDRTVRLWNAATGKAIETVHLDGAVSALAVSVLSMQIVAGQASGQLVFLDLVEPGDHPPASTTA